MEKVVIPKHVAEWLQVCKENLAVSLLFAMTPDVLENNKQSEETIYWMKSVRNQEIFARAWLDGYEIEQEKLYTVEIPDPNNGVWGYTTLYRLESGKIRILMVDDYDWRNSINYQLTEAEIKEDFDWAWQAGFAKEVIDEQD